jgi:hypothetical protein
MRLALELSGSLLHHSRSNPQPGVKPISRNCQALYCRGPSLMSLVGPVADQHIRPVICHRCGHGRMVLFPLASQKGDSR